MLCQFTMNAMLYDLVKNCSPLGEIFMSAMPQHVLPMGK